LNGYTKTKGRNHGIRRETRAYAQRGIAHRVAIRKDKAAHTWFAVGVQEGENLRTCGFEYYQTKEECLPELEWFRYTYPERRFKIALVIRDDINEKEVAVND